MRRNRKRQYTIRSIPADVDRALRQTARRNGTSLNDAVLDALRRGAGLAETTVYTDLDACIGTWVDDPAIDAALAEQDSTDEALWR